MGRLEEKTIELSEADCWERARTEWSILTYYIDYGCKGICECGHHGLKECFILKNLQNGNMLFPVGNSCVEKFHSGMLKEEAEREQRRVETICRRELEPIIAVTRKNPNKFNDSSFSISKDAIELLYKLGVLNYYEQGYIGERYDADHNKKLLSDVCSIPIRNRRPKQQKAVNTIFRVCIIPGLMHMNDVVAAHLNP